MIEEKKLTSVRWFVAGLLLIALVIGCVYVLGSKNSAKNAFVPLTDPETGLQIWIEAVNDRNIDRLYDLAPDMIKNQSSLAKFKEDNLNNSVLKPGSYLVNYTLIDKKQNGTYSQIIAQVFLSQSVNPGNNTRQEIPIQYRFGLFYEHGEWKVWTLKWT